MRIATRGSTLARTQARIAAAALEEAAGVETTELVVRTIADRRPDAPLDQLEGQGWFVAELEQALLEGRADVAVHSAKDLPATLPPGLRIAAYLPRDDPRDAAVSRGRVMLGALAEGSRVGTSSPRRSAFLGALYPRLSVVALRGNVDTRLRKLRAGDVDALVVAAAGLDRLGRGEAAAERLDAAVFVPAPGQGAIALETARATVAERVCAGVDHGETRAAVSAERAVLEALGGGCVLPLGVWARPQGAGLVVTAALGRDGGLVRAEAAGAAADAVALGRRVAAQLR